MKSLSSVCIDKIDTKYQVPTRTDQQNEIYHKPLLNLLIREKNQTFEAESSSK